MNAIEIVGFEKRYRTGFFKNRIKVGLHALTLTVTEGEVFGCLGPNGAGKTTTLKLLMGLVTPSAGRAYILGRDWRDAEVRSRIGFLPEQPYFYDQLTARELVEYLATLSGVDRNLVSLRAREVLDLVGLSGASSTLQLRKLSKGMLQRVGLAQAIVHDPEILFLDEPMSGLDPIGRREVRDLILAMKKAGKTVFFSTHILSDAEALCERVAVLYQGELRGVGVVSELRSQKSGLSEVVWEGPNLEPGALHLLHSCIRTGTVARAEVLETDLDAVIDAIRCARARLVAITPQHSAVEDYFFQSVGSSPQTLDDPSPVSYRV